MTPDERMQKYLKGEEVDCVPYGLLAPDDAMAHIWGYTRGDMMRSFDLRCEIIRRKKNNMVLLDCRHLWDFEVLQKLQDR